jgi:uncharacterized protein (TIGR02996 family)
VTERDALLAAIRANPDDDATRLVFADWLDEHEPDARPRKGKGAAGAPSSWAALIRAECEFAQLQGDGSEAAAVYDFFTQNDDQTLEGVRWERALPAVARRVDLRETAKRSRAKARRSLTELLPKNVGVWSLFDTLRGFPNTLYITRQNKVDVTRFTRLPPFHIRFGYSIQETPDLVTGLIADGLLRNVRALTLSGHQTDLMPALSISADVVGVREFELENGPASVIVRWITTTANWTGLRALRLDPTGGLDREDAVEVFGARILHKLTQLYIQGAENWTPHTIRNLAAFTNLRELHLVGCGLGDRAAECLAEMPGLANLRSLNLTDNRVGGAGASALLASPHLKNLAALDLTNNAVRGLNRKVLANAPAGGLRVLGLQRCQLTLRDVTTITTCPRVSELMYFAVCNNGLAESVVDTLVKGFGSRAPAVLYLMGSQISTAGAEALANWPAASQIDMLHLQDNQLSAAGAKALACCPHLKGLTHICAGVADPECRAVLKKRFGKRASV